MGRSLLLISALALSAIALTSRADTPKEETPKEPPITKAQIEKSANNLKQIGLAFHNYHDTYGHLPMNVLDKNGKPLLSWRVAILPFIEQDNLYRSFKLDEPWDSDHNKKLLARIPELYKPVRKKSDEETFYRVFVGNGAMFDKKEKVTFARITDGLSNTFMAIEAGESVPWTKPDELEYHPRKKIPELGGMFDGDFHALFGDGVVRKFRKGKKAESLHRLIVRNDGDVRQEDLEP